MNPFELDSCCKHTSTEVESLIAGYYDIHKDNIDRILNEVYRAELFGKNTEQLYNIGNDMHYFLIYLVMIKLEMLNDEEYDLWLGTGCGFDKGIDFYTEKYNLDCIRKHFFCNGMRINQSDALDLFGLNDNEEEDGIGFMHIDWSNKPQCEDKKKAFIVR